MQVGTVKEVKDSENRVGLTPEGAAELIAGGNEVVVERGAGLGSGFSDADYEARGARLCGTDEAWDSDLVIKIKEPLVVEYPRLKGQMVFTYFHLAGVTASLTEALLTSRTTAVAYETLEDMQGRLPLLAPMSAVAGTMAPMVGAYYLAKFNGGRGILPASILGDRYGKIAIIGDGVVGRHSARVAAAWGARVAIFGRHQERGQEIKATISPEIDYVLSSPSSLTKHVKEADILVGAVLLEGARAPHLVSEAMVRSMPRGAVIVDVSIDQGGCVETSRPTTHSDPVYTEHGVIHYCVANMPGAYPRTSTYALTRATLPYAVRLAREGIEALRNDKGFSKGVNTYKGYLTTRAVSDALGLEERYRAFDDIED